MTIRKAAGHFDTAAKAAGDNYALREIALGLQELAKSLARELESIQSEVKRVKSRVS